MKCIIIAAFRKYAVFFQNSLSDQAVKPFNGIIAKCFKKKVIIFQKENKIAIFGKQSSGKIIKNRL